MEWIEKLSEPITKLDVIYGLLGYLTFKWLNIGVEVCKSIYKNSKNKP
tara:strand:- start:340 stop:483 length:144 start_codon:yes stop_codon:yes gene_type:complete